MVPILLGVLVALATVRLTSPAQPQAVAPTCTAAAAAQLPKPLVASVNAVEAKQLIAPFGRDMPPTILKQRPLPNGGAVESLADFDPWYCGFKGSLNFVGLPADQHVPLDHIVFMHDGRRVADADPKGVCVSNTVPTTQTVNGVFVMTLRCDRLYPRNTLLQTDPVLTPLP